MRALAVARSSQVSQSKDATGSGTRVRSSAAVSRLQGQPGEAAVLVGECAQFPAERRRAVRGHERLVAPVGVGEQHPFGATAPQSGQQPPYGGHFEERQVGREDHDGLGGGVPQTGVERGDRARAGRFLTRPAHRPGGGPRVGYDDRGPGVGTGTEPPVEQRATAHP